MTKSSQSLTMSCSCLLFLFHFLLLLKFSSLSLGASDSVYDSFVNCLTTKSIPQSEISKIVYSPNNASFNPILQAYVRNRRFFNSSKPVIIVTPTEESHVSRAVLCTKETNLQLKIRSGGHDYEGISYISNVPFIILDMFNLRSISINVNDNTAWVQAGATLGELYYNIWTKSNVLGFPAGVCPTVGVGGHLSGGGYGNMLRKFGLSVDNVLDARLVDVNGRILDRKAMGEDLFWAIKGGGGASFGVILAFQIQLVQVPQTVTYFRVERFLDQNATDAVLQWQNVVNKIDNDLFIRLLVQPITVTRKEKVKEKKNTQQKKTIRAKFLGLFLGDSRRLMTLVSKEFPALRLQNQDCYEMSWIDSVLRWASFDNTTKPIALLNRTGDVSNLLKRKSDYVQEPIPRDGLESIFQKMISLGNAGIVFNPYGGRMAEIGEDETPFPHRAGILFKIQYSVNWKEEGAAAEKEYLTQIRDLYSFMTPFVSKNPRQAYLNYRDLDIGTNDQGPHSLEEGRVYGTKYFKNNFDRLVKVKSEVDPSNFFRNEQSIPTQIQDIGAYGKENRGTCFSRSLALVLGECLIWMSIIL